MKRYIRTFRTHSQAALVETDAGEYYIKAINNSDGPPVLIAEWIGYQAANWLGLPVPEFAMVELHDTVDVPLDNAMSQFAKVGPCFGSKRIRADGWKQDAEILEHLGNPEDIPSVVVIDTWLRNVDRFCVNEKGQPRFCNPGNILISDEGPAEDAPRLFAIDFGWSFGGPSWTARSVCNLGDSIRDKTIYGLFPEFRSHMVTDLVRACVRKLRQIDKDLALEWLEGIPREWRMKPAERDALARFLTGRAAFLADHLEEQCWDGDRLW